VREVLDVITKANRERETEAEIEMGTGIQIEASSSALLIHKTIKGKGDRNT
jgi:hypothetical protein